MPWVVSVQCSVINKPTRHNTTRANSVPMRSGPHKAPLKKEGKNRKWRFLSPSPTEWLPAAAVLFFPTLPPVSLPLSLLSEHF